MTLAQMRDVDVRTVDPSTLVEVTGLTVDSELPPRNRKVTYVRIVGNPYCVRVHGIPVKMMFSGGASMTERMESVIAKTY